MFCSMYARFWCRLHTIDDTAGQDATLVSLCVLFLHLLEVMLFTSHLHLNHYHVYCLVHHTKLTKFTMLYGSAQHVMSAHSNTAEINPDRSFGSFA